MGTSGVHDGMPCFVAGPENRVATVALKTLLQENSCDKEKSCSTGIQFNPIVLLGATGCGKTHLAHGLANLWRERILSHGHRPEKVAYFSAAEFGRIYDQARERDKLTELRATLRNLQLLVLEDLHTVRSRAVIQLELRHTVDALLADGGMILVTSQKSLATIPSLEPGLRDRLASGLTIRLRPPGLAARLEVLQLTASTRGTDLSFDQAQQMSQQLEGPVPRLFQAIAKFEQNPLSDEPHPHAFIEDTLSMQQIVAVVARYFSLSQVMLRGPSRRRSVVHVRNVVVYLTRLLTSLSYAQIGRNLGKRDHTTTMHADRRIRQLLSTDPATQETVDDLKRILSST